MYSTPASEREALAVLKQRANVEVPNLSWLTSLPTPDYRRALAVLDAAMDHEVPEPVKFIAKLCFSDRRAAAYYRRIFEWWSVARGDTEPLSLEAALRRTFSKPQTQWTWQKLQGIPVDRWPPSVVRCIWRGNVPHDDLRHQLLSLLHTGQCNIHTLTEIARIGDPALIEAILAQPNLPRQVRRAIPGASARKQNATPPVYLSSRELAATQEVFSAEIDEDGASESITELAARMGWPAALPAFDVEDIKPRRALLLWRDQDRTLAATRDDETTLIVVWQIANR